MRVSKHHYAIELAELGNKVYFIEPPDIKFRQKFRLTLLSEYNNLFIVSYKPIARGKRFLPKVLYKMLIKAQVNLLVKKIGEKPNIVFSFDPYRFENLKWFKAQNSIFFCADLYSPVIVPGEAQTADICFGVSPSIVSLLKIANPKSFFINHGLNAAFAKLANERLNNIDLVEESKDNSEKISVGYIGNLLIGSLDRKTIREIIETYSDIDFIFWGQYERGQDNMIAFEAEDVWEFIHFLKTTENVSLRGPKAPDELIQEIQDVDVFWVAYDINANWQVDGSNSHKILEYLALGKPVIANFTLTYEKSELIYMLQEKNNKNYPLHFEQAISKIKLGENKELIQKRLCFALSNTYQKNIALIDSILAH